MERLPLLIYDGDCGFCTRSVWLVERLPVRCDVAPWQETDLGAFGVNEARARDEVMWIAPDGRVFGGASAVAELLKHCAMPWRLLGWVLSAPLIRTLAALVYRWVAANRSRLPGVTPACHLPPERRPGGRQA